MVGKTRVNVWKPVKLEGPLISGDIEGLIGIEELTDYDDSFLGLKNNLKRKNTETYQIDKKKIKTAKETTNGIKNAPGTFVKNPSVQKASKQKIETDIAKYEPGAFVRSPKIIQKASQKIKKRKREIGEIVEVNEEEKLKIDDLIAWRILPIPEVLLQGLADLGFTKPTTIQALTLPPAILGRRDILGAAETGSGKTLAFGLPILKGILEFKKTEKESSSQNESSKPLFALILTPTRELAIQIKNHLIAVAKHTDIKIAVVLGGMAQVKQERILKRGPEIVVATPGRLWEMIQEGNPHLSQVDDIKYLVIDETDRMLEKSHFQELHQLLERINMDETKRNKRQNFVFSATLTMVHDLPGYLVRKKKIKNVKRIHKLSQEDKLQNIIDMLGINEPKIVDVTEKSGTAKSLTECRINCELEEKDNYLYYFLQKHPGRTLIFCNSIDCVRRVANLLCLLGCISLPLHAEMRQKQRLKNLEKFSDNPNGILVATDVAARGLDIANVEHVLHYQIPRTSEGYVHRSGRTARASKEGITVLLIEPKEVNNYLKLCNTLGRTEDLPNFPILENFLTAVKQRVRLAKKLEVLEYQFKKSNSQIGWLQKAAKEMDIILDEEMSVEVDNEEVAKKRRQISAIRQELNHLLSKPIFPKGFSVNYPTSSGELQIPLVQGDQSSQRAVEVMKNHIKNLPEKKNYHLKKILNRNNAIKEKKQVKQEKKDSKKKTKTKK